MILFLVYKFEHISQNGCLGISSNEKLNILCGLNLVLNLSNINLGFLELEKLR
jgi:hypothetical protein